LNLAYHLETCKYIITKFEDHHNHEIIPESQRHFSRSVRRIPAIYKVIADINADAGINVRSSFDSMRIAAGGPKNLTFLHLDLKNHIRNRRERQMQGGVVEFLLDYFVKQTEINMGNYSKIKIDKKEDAQIESIFWADAQMRRDYRAFGDCFSFDTTYRTNKHHRPLGMYYQ
ncbi:Protein FAR1-RELATED SEQUENCE 5, partial [Linum perenne]